MLKSLSTKFRLSLGLVSILVSLMMTAAFLNLIPDRTSAILEGRAALAELIAANSSIYISRSDVRRMEANLELLLQRNPEIRSAALVRENGDLMAEVGDHQQQWQKLEQGVSSPTQIAVPILERGAYWGQVQLRYAPLTPAVWYGFLYNPLVQLLVFVGLMGFVGFYFYLGRMLKHLDPSQAIPDRVRSALNTMAEGLLVLDAKQNIVLANEAFCQIVDLDAQALLGKPISRFSWQNQEGSAVTAADTPWQKALASGAAQMSQMIRLPEEEGSKTFMTNCSPVLNSKGSAAGVLISFDDVTELEEKEIELRASKEDAERANRAKSDFLANMSHEIRTPMNAILGFTEVLKRGYNKNSTEAAKYLNTISSSGQHLLNLINDILDLSKVEADKIEVEQIPCAAHEIVKEVVAIMKVKAEEKGIGLTYQADGQMPAQIQSDPARLRQIITNLVGNAIKFTEAGSVTVITRMGQGAHAAQLEIEVQDTGIGMTQEQAGRIFNPFEQADSSTTRKFGGTGLGLTISKRFAEALGGGIEVLSELGQGSRFITRIAMGDISQQPLLTPADITRDATPLLQTERRAWRFPEARVLVVDDGLENRELLSVVLGEMGLVVETAENGQVGCDKLFNEAFDLVLMDVNMPVMGGYEAVKLMRERGYQLPIIALTANAMKGADSECLAAGYSGYMAKPINLDELQSLLIDELGGAPADAEPTTQPVTPQAEAESAAQPISATTGAPLRSTLADKSPKLRAIVEKFVARLPEQLELMQTAVQANDHAQVADLAHWLKGTAGSVGFAPISEVAAELEIQAKTEALSAYAGLMIQICDLAARIDLGETAGEPLSPAQTESPFAIPARLDSRLPMNRNTFRTIVRKFAERLHQELPLMVNALATQDYLTLADKAHWLKGSAGSVGFDAFTEPAASLEEQAKLGAEEGIQTALHAIQEMSRRMVVPPAEEDSPASSAADANPIPKDKTG